MTTNNAIGRLLIGLLLLASVAPVSARRYATWGPPPSLSVQRFIVPTYSWCFKHAVGEQAMVLQQQLNLPKVRRYWTGVVCYGVADETGQRGPISGFIEDAAGWVRCRIGGEWTGNPSLPCVRYVTDCDDGGRYDGLEQCR